MLMAMMNNNSLVQQSEALAAERGVQPLRLTVIGKSKITLYAAPKPEERDDRVFPHMWVHRLQIRRTKGGLFVTKDTWGTLPGVSSVEITLHEWPAVSDCIGRRPPISFETKQGLFYNQDQTFHDWTDEVWFEDKVKRKFELWKSIRDAEHHDMILLKRDPKWVVNPAETRIIGFVYTSGADDGKARIARIFLDLNIIVAVYHFATGDFKEQVVEEYARPYKPECQGGKKEELRQEWGFWLSIVGMDVKEIVGRTRMHGPPLMQEEFRSALQNQVEYFRRSRVENRHAGAPESEIAVYLVPAVLEGFLGGPFAFEPGKILPADRF
jgi:hypothetical protein